MGVEGRAMEMKGREVEGGEGGGSSSTRQLHAPH